MSTLLVIVPGKNEVQGDCVYSLVNSETGEGLASHLCSASGFAYGDLYGNRPERQEDWQERFGEIEVKFIDETDIDPEELIAKNRQFHASDEEE